VRWVEYECGRAWVPRIARDIKGSEISGTFVLLGGSFGLISEGKANRLRTTDLFPNSQSFFTVYQMFKAFFDVR
jgi:hypothetical protein